MDHGPDLVCPENDGRQGRSKIYRIAFATPSTKTTSKAHGGSGKDGSGIDGRGADETGTDGIATYGTVTDRTVTDGIGTDGIGANGIGTDGSGIDGSGTDRYGTDGTVSLGSRSSLAPVSTARSFRWIFCAWEP